MKEYLSTSEQQTYKIAAEIAKTLKPGDIVLLQGDLGAGKTAFVKGVAESFGYDKEEVTSPTFTLINIYSTKTLDIYHFDLYRLENPEELYNIGFEEYLYGNGICFVEWAERARELIVGQTKTIEIIKMGESQRKIIVED